MNLHAIMALASAFATRSILLKCGHRIVACGRSLQLGYLKLFFLMRKERLRGSLGVGVADGARLGGMLLVRSARRPVALPSLFWAVARPMGAQLALAAFLLMVLLQWYHRHTTSMASCLSHFNVVMWPVLTQDKTAASAAS